MNYELITMNKGWPRFQTMIAYDEIAVNITLRDTRMKALIKTIVRRIVISALTVTFLCVGPVLASRYTFTVCGDKTYLNGREILVKGLRCSNALISDCATEELIANLDTFASYGVNTVSVFFMGSRFGDVKGYNEDATLNPVYSARMRRIVEAADRRGMIVLVGCLYWGGSRAKWESWTQTQANTAVANTVRWLKENDYRNVFVDVDNEGMARKAKGFDNRQMVIAGKKVDPQCVIATNYKGDPPPEADLAIHHSNKVPGKAYIESEGTPTNAPGRYWGTYSKKNGYYNYINIGIYNAQMKQNQKSITARHLENGWGYMCAATWLQCVAPHGPNNRPGGDGSDTSPGIKWWLEFLRDTYGPYIRPPAAVTVSKKQRSPTTATVGQWDRFEASIENTRLYSNPYKDVALDVVYTRPDGSKVQSWGFYDGSKTWKIRFMPDVPGLWRYEASFSDAQPGKNGQFRCVESTSIPGMISADEENPIWFGFKGGAHILVRSFHVGDRFFAENFGDSQRSAFLNWAQQQGYNMLSVASHYLNRNAEGRGKSWQTPGLWDSDSQQPKASEYRRMELILDNLSDRKMMIFPFAGFFGRDSNYPKRPSEQSLYIQYTLGRIGHYWNILLNVAGPEPLGGRKKFLADDIDRLGSEIARLDVFGHPLSVHNRTGDDYFGNKPYISYVTLQGPKTTDRAKLSDGLLRNHHRSKPLYAQETLWANNQNHPKYSAEDIRKNAYVILMSAATLNFAENNGNSSSGFSGTLDLTDRNQRLHDIVKMVWDFFESVPFYKMTPRQDLVDNGFCLAEPGRRYLVYLPSGGTVNISLRREPYAVTWINAQKPSEGPRPAGTQTYDAGRTDDGEKLTAPPRGDDWLLYLTKAGRPTDYATRAPVPAPPVSRQTQMQALID